MHYRVFYLFDRSGESISSASAVEMSARTICEQLLPRLQSEDDYLGLVDAEDNILESLDVPDASRYWVELPIDAAKASYGRYLDRAFLSELMLGLPAVFDRESIPGLEYRPW